jgi:hypothetical protein
MPATDHKLRVFLCHASQDKPAVRELYKRLATEGWIDPWLDEEKLLPGQNWNLEIEKAVEESDAVIVCLSNESVSKEGYVQRELKFALDIALEKPEGTIFIIPIRLENCEPLRRLLQWQFVDYFPPKQRKVAYQRLLDSLKTRATKLGIATTRQKRSILVDAPELSPNQPGPADAEARIRGGRKRQVSSRLDVAALQEIIGAEVHRHTTTLSAEMLHTERQQQAFAVLSHMDDPKAIEYLRQLTPEGMVLIPAGDFLMGSGRYHNESPQTKVRVNSFYMARFPVTNGEYRLFMLDGGYSRQECWTRAGWNWVQVNQRTSPWRWRSESWQTKANHPVEWISWYEAMAYARWMAMQKGGLYRLPTEAEWEKAASWDEDAQAKREFPWGDQFDKKLCNLDDPWAIFLQLAIVTTG